MPTFTVEIETPLGVKQFGLNGQPDIDSARTHVQLLQARLNDDGQPLMPDGEISIWEGDPGDPLGKKGELAAGAAKLGFDRHPTNTPPAWSDVLAKPEDEIVAHRKSKKKSE